ncbi:M56 family peptidase [Flavobacterium sp. GA093]|uniref:M56 family peptidase n=2 Tax=Flavobacterium hydrocarbonoxydans TaxID=2683249 RepID=A0A6I4NT52_9FLAO|nr:M56 family peptidase [Flavobacterium hydrocarbonoxydans]
MFWFNRFYLLLSLMFSLLIPFNFFLFQRKLPSAINGFHLDGIIITNKNKIEPVFENYNLTNLILGIYFIVGIILITRFFWNLYTIYIEIKNHEKKVINNRRVVLLTKSSLPHSFWSIIFINKEEFENGKISSELIAHEEAHLHQKHTLDVLLIEVLQLIFWFNPIFILYKKAIKLNHEFLADDVVNKQFNAVSDYQKLLLNFASNKRSIALASNINYLITKKRFIMMTKRKSMPIVVLKSVVVLNMFVFLFLVFTTKNLAQDKNSKLNVSGFEISYDTTSVKEPVYPGGMGAFYMFVGQNFKMPAEATKNKIETKILMQFMVEKDGSLSEFKTIKDAGYGLGEEAIRVLKLSPKWNPATQDGNPVRVLYSLPITIQSQK